MDVDTIFEPYRDISGECYIWKNFNPSDRHSRPHLKKRQAAALGLSSHYRSFNVQRGIWFYRHPETDPETFVVMNCGDNRCVRVSHIVFGGVNPPRERGL